MSRRVTAAIMWLALSGLCAAVLSLAGVYLYLDPQLPKAETYRHVRLETPLRVYTADRELIAEFGERRLIPVALTDVPDQFIRAVLDTEDKRFYEHSGVDIWTLSTAAFELVWNMGEITRGGSTITMQLPRNLGTFSRDQVFIRKFKEILLALKMERELTKDEILELYINAVPFGKRAYGAQAAAFTYYGKPLSELSLAQLAMLAGIPQAPTAGNPINGPQRALARRNLVLRRMLEQGSIDQAAFEAASQAPITASVHDRDLDVPAAFPAEWVRQQLIRRYDDLYTGGYEVVTTLKGNLQKTADTAVRSGLLAYDRRHGYRGPEQTLPIDEDNPLTEDRARSVLSTIPAHGELAPAVVLTVTPEMATVVASGVVQPIRLDLAGVRWARTFIDADTRGPAISRVDEVLAVGDLIRVEHLGRLPVEEEAEEDAQDGAEQTETAAEPATVDSWRLAQLPAIQGALISIEPGTGAVLALSGGFDFGMSQYNHALQAARQPGSGFKPFVYSAALDAGITPASIFMDAPLVFEDENLESEYRPDNDNNRYNGPTRLREALYRSINLVSMRVLLQVGAGKILDFAPRFGFDTSTFPRNTQLAIGGGTMAVTPVDMVRAYAVFANGGFLVQPHIVSAVYDINGEEVFRPRYPVVCRECETGSTGDAAAEGDGTDLTDGEPATLEELLADPEGAQNPETEPPLLARRVIDEGNAFIMHSMLRDVIQRGTGTRARRELERADLAGKTGTTNEAADTWFNGYHPEVATTVWVGFPDHQPLGATEYGSNRPLPIWIEYMREALKDLPPAFPDQPPGVVTRKINPSSGQLAAAGDPDAIFEYFLARHVPKAVTTPLIEDDDGTVKAVDIF